MIRRFERTNNENYTKIPGRPAVLSDEKTCKRVENYFKRNPSASTSAAAKALRLTQSNLKKIKLRKLGIKAHRKVLAPKYQNGQEERAKSGCRKVYTKSLRKVLIQDDETYVPWEPDDVPGIKYFHAKDAGAVQYKHKVKPKQKIFQKILVWQAIDENGNVSDPFISEGTINAQVYLNECLKKRLLPFIDQHYRREEVIFWPDLASAHYANIVTSFLRDEKIPFVEKKENAPNVPQARGIEKFWALCKRSYSGRKDKPKSVRGFARIWQNISRHVAEESGKKVMDHARRNLIQIGYHGITSSKSF